MKLWPIYNQIWWSSNFQIVFFTSTETETQRQLDSANKRYDDLKIKLNFRVDDLKLAEQYIDRDATVNEQLAWATKTESNIQKMKPSSGDIEPLEQEINQFQVLDTFICFWISLKL